MLKQFLNHIDEKNLCSPSQKILLAVSGGVDSMAMFDLFLKTGFSIGVAHCNFQLRKEADEEQDFVEDICKKHGVPVHVTKFDTARYAEEHAQSIQIAARNLRYEFFRSLVTAHGYHCVATAHHADDNLETVLLNLVRGTGIDGLTGIPVKNEHIIRPLLFATRQDVLRYANENKLVWKEDSSNEEDHYKRNYIRHHVIPLLQKLNPSLHEGFTDTIERIRGSAHFASLGMDELKKQMTSFRDDGMWVSKQMMILQYGDVLLWEWIKAYGFRLDQCREILRDHQTGKRFIGTSHQLVVDRDHYVLTALLADLFSPVHIYDQEDLVKQRDEALVIEKRTIDDETVIDRNRNIAQVDIDRISFPLIWRPWKEGDHFNPLGMKGAKKISDYLIDEKVPRSHKERITVVESAGEVIWVVGHRISEKVKISPSTRQILIITHKPSGNDFV